MDYGRRIAELRTQKGMTQEDLAARLYVSRDLVSKWETGARRSDYAAFERISAVLGVTTDSIIGKEELLFDEFNEIMPDGFDPDGKKLTEYLGDFLAGVRKEDAVLFMLRYYRLKGTSEISSELGIKENGVRARLSRIRKMLRKYLEELNEKHKTV